MIDLPSVLVVVIYGRRMMFLILALKYIQDCDDLPSVLVVVIYDRRMMFVILPFKYIQHCD